MFSKTNLMVAAIAALVFVAGRFIEKRFFAA